MGLAHSSVTQHKPWVRINATCPENRLALKSGNRKRSPWSSSVRLKGFNGEVVKCGRLLKIRWKSL
ncbi:hypothetical protein Hanom_Chr02g00142911 [Helianthus anomalus]